MIKSGLKLEKNSTHAKMQESVLIIKRNNKQGQLYHITEIRVSKST